MARPSVRGMKLSHRLAVVAAVTVCAAAPAAPAGAATVRCADVILQPSSGYGAFNVYATGISCRSARRLLRSSSGLRSWSCRVTRRFSDGSRRWRCTSRGRRIAFTEGS